MRLKGNCIVLALGLIVPQGVVHAEALPPDLETARQEVLRIASANTMRTDNIPAVREELTPHMLALSEWFALNRPANEVELTQVPWRSLWYDDPDIEEASNIRFGKFSLRQEREKIYQVVLDGFYYNVGESVLSFGNAAIPVQTFLKGEYGIIRPAGPGTAGRYARNTVDLEFVSNSIRVAPLRDGTPLVPLTVLVETGRLRTIAVPGPIGVTGQLWNLYVDDELRISAGFDDAQPEVIDVYILRRVARVGD